MSKVVFSKLEYKLEFLREQAILKTLSCNRKTQKKENTFRGLSNNIVPYQLCPKLQCKFYYLVFKLVVY